MFGTEQLTGQQWLLALLPAVGAALFLWELGKLIARRGTEPVPEAVPAETPSA